MRTLGIRPDTDCLTIQNKRMLELRQYSEKLAERPAPDFQGGGGIGSRSLIPRSFGQSQVVQEVASVQARRRMRNGGLLLQEGMPCRLPLLGPALDRQSPDAAAVMARPARLCPPPPEVAKSLQHPGPILLGVRGGKRGMKTGEVGTGRGRLSVGQQ